MLRARPGRGPWREPPADSSLAEGAAPPARPPHAARAGRVAVAIAALLVALAASSSPLVRTAAASSALKSKLDEFTPFVTGLQIRGASYVPGSMSPGRIAAREDARAAAVDTVERSLSFA